MTIVETNNPNGTIRNGTSLRDTCVFQGLTVDTNRRRTETRLPEDGLIQIVIRITVLNTNSVLNYKYF